MELALARAADHGRGGKVSECVLFRGRYIVLHFFMPHYLRDPDCC